MEHNSDRWKCKENTEKSQQVFPGPAMKAELHQIPEILELIFSYLDTWTVRHFRFVNKIWNLEASNRSRKTTSVTVQQVDSQHESFTQLLSANRALNLSLPFSSVTVWVDRWNTSILHEVVKDSRLSLHLKFFDTSESGSALHHYRLMKLLACSKLQSILVSLELGSCKNSRMFLKSDFPLAFPKLKHLTISSAIGDAFTLEFILAVINHAINLRSITFGAEIQRNYLVQLFERGNMTNIIDFSFDISSGILPARDILPNMERLRVTMVPEASNEHFTVPRQLVREFTHMLKELEIYWNSQELNVNLLGFPQCLHLSKLTIYNWGGHIGAFSFERLPSLKEICLFQDIIATDNFAFTNIHPGVEIFKFNQGVLYPNDLILPSHFHRFLSHVSVQFPSLKTLFLTWHIGPETMQVILRKFPRLARLELNSKFGYHESVLTGSTFGSVINVRNYWRNGFNWNRDDYLTLASLKHLKHLRLQHGWNSADNPDYEFFPVTNRAIKHGISSLPALETLRLTWTPKLSASALAEYLPHVKNILVDVNTATDNNSDSYLQLRLLWPQVKILRARHKSLNVSWMSKILGWVRSFLWLEE